MPHAATTLRRSAGALGGFDSILMALDTPFDSVPPPGAAAAPPACAEPTPEATAPRKPPASLPLPLARRGLNDPSNKIHNALCGMHALCENEATRLRCCELQRAGRPHPLLPLKNLGTECSDVMCNCIPDYHSIACKWCLVKINPDGTEEVDDAYVRQWMSNTRRDRRKLGMDERMLAPSSGSASGSTASGSAAKFRSPKRRSAPPPNDVVTSPKRGRTASGEPLSLLQQMMIDDPSAMEVDDQAAKEAAESLFSLGLGSPRSEVG